MEPNRGLVWHCQHDCLVEYVHDLQERKQYIKVFKPAEEQPLRLRLLQIIPEGELPPSLREAQGKLVKAWAEFEKAWAEWDIKDKERLHQKLCPNCPFDGKTIFTRKDKNGVWY